jgi:hypothetical protein
VTRKTMALFLLSLLLVVYTTTTALAKNTQGGNPGEGSGNEDKPAELNPAGVALHIGQHVGVSIEVMTMLAWPSISDPILGLTFLPTDVPWTLTNRRQVSMSTAISNTKASEARFAKP